MHRIVDISGEGRHLSVQRGHMVVSSDGQEIGRVALDDIAAVSVHARGATYSNNLICALAERGALLVVCAANFAPVAVLTPLVGHHAQTAHMIAQAEAGKPLKKRLWQSVVRRKIAMQASALEAAGQPTTGFHLLERKVKSGDPENVEAQAARRYWQLMFGDAFRRDRNADGTNAMLNYGYAVIRSTCARAIVAAGLNPSLGIHHHNRLNAFALADDLMEPFRPMVDVAVHTMMDAGIETVDAESKRRLADLTVFDLPGPKGASPLHVCAARLAQSLADSFVGSANQLVFPGKPEPLALRAAGEGQCNNTI